MTVNFVAIGRYSLLDSSIDGHTVRIRTGSAVHEVSHPYQSTSDTYRPFEKSCIIHMHGRTSPRYPGNLR